MAELYQFIHGSLNTEFLQKKTSDNIYLKDLLEGTVGPAIEQYNATVDAMASILCYRFDDVLANMKRLYSDDGFDEIGPIERPGMKSTMDSWNYPQPLVRYGSATKLTMELFKQMSSKQFVEYVNGKMLADKKNIIKVLFRNMLTKTPTSRVDCLTSIAATPKAFWNDEASMDTPRANGQITFDGDHQHFITVDVANTTDADDISELTGLVTEHEGMAGAQLILWVRPNTTEATQIKALTGFRQVESVPALLNNPNSPYMTSGFVQTLVNSKQLLGQRAGIVGTYKENVVVETPDMPDNYVLCTAYLGDNSVDAPLGWREHPLFKGLILANEHDGNPIVGADAQWRRYMSGFVNNRSAGAAMYCADTTWADPTIS